MNPKQFLKSPLGVILKIILVVLIGELAIMLIIEGIQHPLYDDIVPRFFWEFLDAFLLATIVSPVLYVTVLRPMNAQAQTIMQQKGQLSTIFNTLSEGVTLNEMVFDDAGEMIDYRIMKVNEAFYAMADYRGDGPVIGRLATELYGMDSETIRTFWQSHKDARDSVCSEMISPLSGRYFAITTSPFVQNKFVTTFQDISGRKQTEHQREESSKRLSDLIKSVDGIVWEADARTFNFTFVSEQALHITGYEAQEWLRPGFWADHLHPEDRLHAIQLCTSYTARLEPHQFEYRFVARDGRIVWLHDKVVVIAEEGTPRWLRGLMMDITERKTAEERIEKLAHFDQLTGLPNHTLLNDRFKYALNLAQRSEEPLAVLFLDLDNFKDINGSLGHSIGDVLLRQVSQQLKLALREEDTISRKGGDEFVLLLPGTDADGAAHVANKLLQASALPCNIEGQELAITSSIGIAIFPDDGESLESLSKNADTAMYRAKNAGRNTFCFFAPEMQLQSSRNLQLAIALRHALAHNELEVHYQPQLSIQDGHIVGAEALLRWRHPEFGMISPAEFIPIAEDTGQIIQIGEWVLRTATTQLKSWLEEGLPAMTMAVNLSAIQFRQPDLPDRITNILQEVGLPHEYLELELTEAATLDNPQNAIAIMDNLHERGIRMSIDDFGTGYSSLNYLKQFKVYKLKIDQSFVRDIPDDADDKAIVTAIISMATGLGMHTIAEGVETADQLAFLRLQGCNEVQGYYFSKPLPAEQFREFLKAPR